jgi:glycosyltransferase involved in cell wall biosynthesis
MRAIFPDRQTPLACNFIPNMPLQTNELLYSTCQDEELSDQERLLIVVPCFQDTKIEGCLDSIWRHTNSAHTSILVVDDCSSSEFTTFLHDISFKRGFILVRNDENKGPAFSRNIGIRHAIENNYNYITFVDSDDQLIADIHYSDYNLHDITIYNSIELGDQAYGKTSAELSLGSDYSQNDCRFTNIYEALAAYLLKPNRVPTFSTCWAKVFSVNLLASASSSLFFDERMRTFEDVDFVIRYCSVARSVAFNESYVYAHTRYQQAKGATFGKDFNSMFSFLQMARSVRKLLGFKDINNLHQMHHFIAAYYSIQIIRCATKVNGLRSFFNFYRFISNRVRSPLAQRAFSAYNPRIAGGRVVLKSLVRFRLPLVLSVFAVLWAHRRYGIPTFNMVVSSR